MTKTTVTAGSHTPLAHHNEGAPMDESLSAVFANEAHGGGLDRLASIELERSYSPAPGHHPEQDRQLA